PVAERDGRRLPGEEPEGGRPIATEATSQERLVHGHVVGAVAPSVEEEAPPPHGHSGPTPARGLSGRPASTGAAAGARPASGPAGARAWSPARRGGGRGSPAPPPRSGSWRRRTRRGSPSTRSRWARS